MRRIKIVNDFYNIKKINKLFIIAAQFLTQQGNKLNIKKFSEKRQKIFLQVGQSYFVLEHQLKTFRDS